MKWRDIEKARRILSKEEGYVVKDWGGRLPVALAYPNSYRIGMSNLGFHAIYSLFNQQPYVVCERLFWEGRSGGPLTTLEAQRDVLDASVLAVSLSFEPDYINLLAMLHAAGMPALAAGRDESYPLLLAGGPAVTANPEPLADICDAFVIGEAEEVIAPLSRVLYDMMAAPRGEVLDALALMRGVYVPGRSELPVRRLEVQELDQHETHTVIWTPDTEFGDMFLLEISRGCSHGCRFCLAGQIYRPFRERSLDVLLAQAERARGHRGRIGLVGAAISDYTQIDELVEGLLGTGWRLSVSSLRVRPLRPRLIAALAESGVRTLTLAPEAGCERLRRAIRKGVTEEDLLEAVDLAEAQRFPALKLYFMVGLPGETMDDVRAIADLVQGVSQRYSGEISINATPFVPKAHTPFQWAPMASTEELEARIAYLQEALKEGRVEVRPDSPAWARVQGILSRGDRRVGQALVEMGGKSSLRAWERAWEASGLDEAEFLGSRTTHERLPWDVVDTGIAPGYLAREHDRAQAILSAAEQPTALEHAK